MSDVIEHELHVFNFSLVQLEILALYSIFETSSLVLTFHHVPSINVMSFANNMKNITITPKKFLILYFRHSRENQLNQQKFS